MGKPDSTLGRPVHTRLWLRLYAAFLLVAFAGVAVSAWLVDRSVKSTTVTQVEERLSYQTTMLGQMTASALFGPLDPGDSSLNGDLRKLGQAVHTQLSLLAPDGHVVADSEATDPLRLPTQASMPEIRQARSAGRGSALRDAPGGSRIFVAQAIIQDGKLLGFSRSSLPMNLVAAQVRVVRQRMAWGALAAGLVALLLGFLVSTRVVRPIRALTEGAKRIGRGDLGARIEVTTADEIGDLAHAFNQMTGDLRETITALDRRNDDLRLVLDNVAQGLLVIDRDGVIERERSAIVERWFGSIRPGLTLWTYLAAHDATTAHMLQLGWEAVCDDILPLDLNLAQMPRTLVAAGRYYDLGYEPILVAGVVQKALVVVSDVTEQREGQRVEAEQREILTSFERILQDRAGFLQFLAEADEILRRLSSGSGSSLDLQRDVHTLRGNAAVFGLASVTEACRLVEAEWQGSRARTSPAVEALAERWRALSSRFEVLLDRRAASDIIEIGRGEYDEILYLLERGTPGRELANTVRDWSLEPAQKTLNRLAGHARALAQRLGKGAIVVTVESSKIHLDGQRWRPFWAAFMHLIRNAVDHGLEPVDERRALGKSELGHLTLRAARVQGEIQIEVSDDGRGVDWDTLAERARALTHPPAQREELVFEHGLSTRTVSDEFSGRGVGMGAARAACQALGGRVEVTSVRGVGTTVRLVVPTQEALVPRVDQTERALRSAGKDA
jgi:signal transduction histidine kinase